MDQLAKTLIQQHERLRQERSPFETNWQRAAEIIAPNRALFNRRQSPNSSKGEKRTQKVFDATPMLALDRFAAAVHSLVTPRNQVWQKFKDANPELDKLIPVRRYYEKLTEVVFAARYAANFDNAVHECYYDLGAFSNMALYTGDTGTKLEYCAVPLWQWFIIETANGVVNGFSREYTLTARNAVKEFGKDKLPPAMVKAAETNPEQEFWFLSVCRPSDDMDVTRADFMGMPYAKFDVCMDNSTVVKREGYRTFRFAVGRYSVSAGEKYGRGPADIAQPDVAMLNDMNKTTMQAAQLRALPPILANRDGIMNAIRMTPGAMNYGGVDSQGRARALPLDLKGDIGLGLEMMDQKRRVIQDIFWNTLFMILVDNPQMTATEAMLRAQEKGALLAPTASRIEAEFLAVISRSELDILAERDALPKVPNELLKAYPDGIQYEIEWDSPMAEARKAPAGIAILRTLEQLAPAAAVDPTVYRRINWDMTTKKLANVNGMPADCLYTDDEMAAIDEQAAQRQQMADILGAAPVAADAAKSLAQAQSIAASSPNQVGVPA